MKKLFTFIIVSFYVCISVYGQSEEIDTLVIDSPQQITQEVAKDTAKQIKKVKVYTYEITEAIAKPVYKNTLKAIKEAKQLKADMIIIHMNTPGGEVRAADSISYQILNAPMPIHVFIDNNAASAGALISISCDSIYMESSARIGAATVVDQTGEVVAEKYQSYMRTTMRSIATKQGRDPRIAEAMVDKDIYIENVTDSGKLVTFTADEAIKHGFCEGKAQSIEEIIEDHLGIEDYEIVKQELTAVDRFINFLVSPAISGILILMIIGGIYFEMQTPGVGFPLGIALLGAVLYFAPLYLEGLAENWEILIFIVGLILIAVEIFVIPGFGVAGISGIVLVFAGLTLSLVGNVKFDFSGVEAVSIFKAFLVVITSTLVAIIGSFYITKRLFTTRTIFGDLALNAVEKRDDGYAGTDDSLKNMIGKVGIAYTILRPSGKVEVENDIYDATAETGYIDKGENIEVVSYSTAQLFVRKIEEEE